MVCNSIVQTRRWCSEQTIATRRPTGDTALNDSKPDELLQRLRHFHDHYFPASAAQFQSLVEHGQHPSILFIGCSDSRLVPYLLTGAGSGEILWSEMLARLCRHTTGRRVRHCGGH